MSEHIRTTTHATTSQRKKRIKIADPRQNTEPSHVKRFFLKKHDLCTNSTTAICDHADEVDEAIELYKKNPAIVFSHNNPWSPGRERRFQERVKSQLNKISHHAPPPPEITLHINPSPGQFSNVPDVAAQADPDKRTDGCISMEMISPSAYKRAGNNFFVN